jgi:hypothetical protein
MKYAEGRVKAGGRVAGTSNRITRELKEMILTALDESGGVDYLVRQAEQNPVAFLTLLGKVLPLQTKSESSGRPTNIRIRVFSDNDYIDSVANKELEHLV